MNITSQTPQVGEIVDIDGDKYLVEDEVDSSCTNCSIKTDNKNRCLDIPCCGITYKLIV